jgi:carbonic anhydrase
LGPNLWGTVAGNEECNTGIQQSPIAIDTSNSPGLSNVKSMSTSLALTEDWKSSQMKILNNGHTLVLLYDPGNSTEYNGKTYQLQQFHFHTPSEHIINEKQSPLEAHFVSSTSDANPKILVISVLFRLGRKNEEIQRILDSAPIQAAQDPTVVSNAKINAKDFINPWSNHFVYEGSLTTPPCTEGVQWIIQQTHEEVSRDQVQEFQTILKGSNNRPIQPANGREIESIHEF